MSDHCCRQLHTYNAPPTPRVVIDVCHVCMAETHDGDSLPGHMGWCPEGTRYTPAENREHMAWCRRRALARTLVTAPGR